MQNASRLIPLLMALSSFAPAYAEGSNPVVVNAPVTQLFQPGGFDDNDNAEVILHGVFPSSCYKVGPVAVSFGQNKREIHVDARAYQYNDDKCIEMNVPFIMPVQLGTLPGGDYTIKVTNAPTRPTSALHVAEASVSTPDEFMYASVDGIAAREESNGQLERVTISGSHPVLFVGCMNIRDVKVQEQKDNTIVLQPVTEILTNEECAQRKLVRRYQRTVELPRPLPSGTYLFHIRTLNGTAMNQLEIVP